MPVVVGVDIGATKLQVVAMSGHRVLGQSRARTPQGGPDELVDVVLRTAGAALASAVREPSSVVAVGVGFPGQFDPASGDTLNATNLPGFHERYPLGRRLSEGLGGARVVIDNDVNAALAGEYLQGNGRGFRNLLGVFWGTGVGGGIILDGALRHGRGAGGEIGHVVVKDRGRQCGCGRRGCLEAYAGRARMELRARQLVKNGDKTILFDVMHRKGRDRLTSGVIEAALTEGDRMTRALLDEAVWALGIGLASAQNLVDVEAIIIGGGLGDRLGQPFIERIADAMKPHLFQPKLPPKVMPTALGDLSGAVGAALLASGRKVAPSRGGS